MTLTLAWIQACVGGPDTKRASVALVTPIVWHTTTMLSGIPDLENSGCFPGYQRVTLPHYEDEKWGLPFPRTGGCDHGATKLFSKDIATLLRHSCRGAKGLGQFLDSRVKFSKRQNTVGTWAAQNRPTSFQQGIRYLYGRTGNGPDTYTVQWLREQVFGYHQDWETDKDYFHIAVYARPPASR